MNTLEILHLAIIAMLRPNVFHQFLLPLGGEAAEITLVPIHTTSVMSPLVLHQFILLLGDIGAEITLVLLHPF